MTIRHNLALTPSLMLLAGMSFVTQLGVSVMLPLIPLYAVSFGATPLQLGVLTSGFAIASSISQFGSGFLIDRFGARSFIRIGIGVYAAANVLIATAVNSVVLIVYRSTAGLGSGANVVATRVYIAQTADPKRMAYVNGVLSAVSSAGSVAGPAVGGIIAALSDLRVPFLLVGITSGLACFASLFLPRPQEEKSVSQDSRRAQDPKSILNRSAVVLLLSQLFLLAGYGAFITTYAPLATGLLGWSLLEVGIVFSVFSLGGIALGPWLAHLADHYGRRWIAMVSCVPFALYTLGMAIAFPRLALYPITFISGGTVAAFSAAWFALLTETSPSASRGRTFGVVSALSQLGVVLGAVIASALWQSANLGTAMMSGGVSVLLASGALIFLPRGSKELPITSGQT